MIELHSVQSNKYKLDGGAMFGNAAKPLWERWIPSDGLNRLRLSTRTLLAITDNDKILFDTGIGSYLAPKFADRFGVTESDHMLQKNLEAKGISEDDITQIFISHMHFDHAGGLLSTWQEESESDLLFPNAKYYVSETAWERSNNPHPRDRASYIPLLNRKLAESQRLVKVSKGDTFSFDALDIAFFHSDGHSPGLLSFDLEYPGGHLVFPTDLIPGRSWVHLPITMGYDRFPEHLIEEKKEVLASIVKNDAWIFYVHDPDIAASKVIYDDTRHTYKPVDEQPELIIRIN